ncbi:hypothetical protein, partial [Klebsiella pneumoniae]|uniref:hypothetical protein n=1 Tax=Klebsiella pneumoniae TaxID=573 RepID=UPI000B6CFC11
AEQEGQQTETEATGAPQKHHYTLNQQVGSITLFLTGYSHGLLFSIVIASCKLNPADHCPPA